MTQDERIALFLGGAVLVGGIGIGKTLVDAGMNKPGAPIPPSSGIGDSIRFVATMVGLTVSLLQLPTAVEQMNKLLEE